MEGWASHLELRQAHIILERVGINQQLTRIGISLYSVSSSFCFYGFCPSGHRVMGRPASVTPDARFTAAVRRWVLLGTEINYLNQSFPFSPPNLKEARNTRLGDTLKNRSSSLETDNRRPGTRRPWSLKGPWPSWVLSGCPSLEPVQPPLQGPPSFSHVL